MNINEIIEKAISIATECSAEHAGELRKLQGKITADRLKVAVIGNFKAGKSTIINRLFLHEPLLPTEYSECTAVPTEIISAPKRLSLWKRTANGEETLVRELADFDAAALAQAVTAPDEEHRQKMAEQYSKAVLALPGVVPDNISLVDTPGLDSTTKNIVLGTMAEARDADALLYVVRGKSLGSKELDLLTAICGPQPEKLPVFVVVTHDENIAPVQVENICRNVKAQMEAVGIRITCSSFNMDDRSAAPVDTSSLGSFTIPETKDSPESWDPFGGAESPAVTADAHGNLGEQLSDFFAHRVQPGRIAKITRELKPILTAIQSHIQQLLAANKANIGNMNNITAQIQRQREEYERRLSVLMDDIKAIQHGYTKDVKEAVDAVIRQKKENIKDKTNIQEVLTEIKSWNEDIPAELSSTVNHLQRVLTRDIDNRVREFEGDFRASLRKGEETTIGFDAGLLGKLPPWVVLIADYALVSIVSPLWLPLDLALRYIFSDLPILPSNIIASLAKTQACKNLDEARTELLRQVMDSQEATCDKLIDDLHRQLSSTTMFDDAETALKKAEEQPMKPEEITRLEQFLAEIESFLYSL